MARASLNFVELRPCSAKHLLGFNAIFNRNAQPGKAAPKKKFRHLQLELQRLQIDAFLNRILNRNAPSGKAAPETEFSSLGLEMQRLQMNVVLKNSLNKNCICEYVCFLMS